MATEITDQQGDPSKRHDLLDRQRDVAAIREGIADMEAGRTITLEELDARIRSRLSMASRQ